MGAAMNPNADSAVMSAEAIEHAAAAWFAKKDSGEWSSTDQAAFDAWLNGSTAHRIAYLRLHAAWKGAARMQALGAGVPRGEVPPPGHWNSDRFLGGKHIGAQQPIAELAANCADDVPSTKSRRIKRMRWAVAAGAILALGLTLFIQHPNILQRSAQYSTPVGGQTTVSLPDDSRVTLNTDSDIRVEFNQSERRIDLRKGEAFFVVAKDPARPFVVYVDDKRVTAVGTEFSVRRVTDDIEVVVSEGRVRLEPASSPLRDFVGIPAPPGTTIAAGAVARTMSSEVLVQAGSEPEIEQLLSWRRGYLVFEATTLAEAVSEFNRYNTKKIVIDDPSLAALRIGGNFRVNNTAALLWLLQSGFGVQVEEVDGSVRLKSR